MGSLEKLSDKELVARMNNGQKEKAFNVLYKRYNSLLYNFCLGKCNNYTLSEEVVQDTFINFYRKSDTFEDRPNSSFKTWIYKIAHNNLINYYRKIRKDLNKISFISDFSSEDFEKDCENDSSSVFVSGVDTPYDLLLKEQRNEFLRNYIEGWIGEAGKLKYHNVIKLRYFAELSYDEISEKLGVPLYMVKSHLFKAKEILEKELEPKKDFLWNNQ